VFPIILKLEGVAKQSEHFSALEHVIWNLRPHLHGNGSKWNLTRMGPPRQQVPNETEPKSCHVNTQNRFRQIRLETKYSVTLL